MIKDGTLHVYPGEIIKVLDLRTMWPATPLDSLIFDIIGSMAM
jgi:hypothetical protein